MKYKLPLLVFIAVTQAFFFNVVIVPEYKRVKAIASIRVGDIWEYKCSLPFHENDSQQSRIVTGITNGFVQYAIGNTNGIYILWDCTETIFVCDARKIGTTAWRPTKQ